MAKKRLTPRQKEWETEYKKIKRRVRDWKRKFHVIPDLPTKPKRITKKDIERLKQFKWKNIDEPTKKRWRQEYEYLYENKIPEIYKPKPPYNPPTESDFLNNNVPETPQSLPQPIDESDEEPDEDGYIETVVSRDEIEAWIERTIYTITVDRELYGVREQLKDLVLEAADAYGDYGGYLNYLESKADTLIDLATKAIYGYRDKSGNIYQHNESALPQFATVLNLGRPLETSQSERLEEEGWVSFDFND